MYVLNDHSVTSAQRCTFYPRVRLFYKEILRTFLQYTYLPMSYRALRHAQILDLDKLAGMKERHYSSPQPVELDL